MGTLIDVQKSIDLNLLTFGTGSWAVGYTTGIYYALHTTANDTSTIDIPITIETTKEGPGSKITSIDIPYFCGTDDLDAVPTAALYKTDILTVKTFAANTFYFAGDYVKPATENAYIYEVTTSGISGASEPTFPTTAALTVTSGTAVFTCRARADNTVNTIAVTTNAAVDSRTTDQMFTVNVTTPTFNNKPGAYVLHLTIDAGSSSVIKLYPPVVNYIKEI